MDRPARDVKAAATMPPTMAGLTVFAVRHHRTTSTATGEKFNRFGLV